MMIFITRFLWLWAKRKSISWGTQQRDDSPLPLADCFRQFAWLSILGLVCWTALLVAIWNVPAGQAALMKAFSGGWLRPSDLLIWFSPILGGFLGSVWIARVTSRTFPSLRARRLFSIPEEYDPPRVISETLEWNSRFRALLPNCENHAETVSYAVGSPQFYARHRQETKIRPHVAKWLLPKISAKSDLTDHELMLALGERNCFDALHVAHANSMK
jgi:membrane glycosyltransferase